MNAAAADGKRAGVDDGEVAIGQRGRQNRAGVVVGFAIEFGDNCAAVGEIKINIGSQKPFAAALDFGLRQFDDLEGATARVFCFGEAGDIFFEGGERGRIAALGAHRQNESGAGEAGDFVDMAVGFVVGGIAGEPDDFFDSEAGAQKRFDFGARQIGVAVGMQKALLGGEQSSFAVDAKRAAFHHERGADAFDFGAGGDAGGELVVVFAIVFAAPGVEAPIYGGDLRAGFFAGFFACDCA